MQFIYFFVFIALLLNGCSKVRESAGVTRKSIDEFQVVEYPPLVIPPDFNLLPPNQLEEKNINEVEKDLAKEILFGLDEEKIKDQLGSSTMEEILTKTEALDVSSSIREEVDKEFAQQIKTDSIFKLKWKNEIEVLDAVKESERLRNKNFDEKITEDEIILDETLIDKEIPKKKKKKRFFFF